MIQAQNLIARMFYARRDRALHQAFSQIFLGPDGLPNRDGALVLGRMRELCHADTSTLKYTDDGSVDPLASAAAEGRRDVWRMFQFYLNISDSELIEIDRTAKAELDKARQLRGVFDS